MPFRPWVVLVGLLFWAACSGSRTRTEHAQPPVGPPTPAMRLVLLTDLNGYLEPCGCQARPLGGIDKLAQQVRELKADGVPTYVFVAGDALFGETKHAAHRELAQTQLRWRAETMATILADIGVQAGLVGRDDRARADWAEVAALGSTRWLAGIEDGAWNAPEAGGLAMLGVSDRDAADPALLSKVTERVRALREAGSTRVLVLTTVERRLARRFAAEAGSDFVLLAGMDDTRAVPPSAAGQGHLLTAGRDGQGYLRIDVYEAAGGLADESEWSRAVKREGVHAQVAELQDRIAVWERDPNVRAQDIAEQRGRVAVLQREASQLEATPALRAGRPAFRATWVELGPERSVDPAIAARVDAYDRRVNEHNRTALADWIPTPAPPGTPAYVGSERCGTCHASAMTWWRATPHGRAYATLQTRDKQFNLDCVACHVTGYGKPSGSTVAHVEGLQDVGCENCHGPGSQHAAAPSRQNIARAVTAATCVGCHNAEHSDQFQFDGYRARLIAPGHGLPPQ